MGIKKQFLKSKPICKVTFKVPKKTANGAESIHLMGQFNNWQKETPMKALKDGSFKVTLELDAGNEYEFRYLIDSKKWINEDEADKSVPSAFEGESNSVIVL